MGLLCILSTMLVIVVLTWVISCWGARTAYRLLETSQSLFEPDEVSIQPASLVSSERSGVAASPNKARVMIERTHASPTNRAYISPITRRLVASRQRYRCSICKQLLPPDWELDHIRPLWRGGNNGIANLQAVCRFPCHQMKSAAEARR